VSTFDLRADALLVDLDVWRMVRGRRHVEDLRLIGLRGVVTRLAKAEREPWYARRATLLDHLVVQDCEVRFVDHTRSKNDRPLEVAFNVEQLTARDISTNWLAFHLLFRTNTTGSIAGRPFRVNNLRSNGAGETEWQFDDLPAALFGEYVGGPFAWLQDGTANVAATTQWDLNAGILSMDWQFDLHDVSAMVPDHLEGWRRRVGEALVGQINRRSEHFPLAFTLSLDPHGFEGSASADAAGLWDAVAEAAMRELASRLGVQIEALNELRERTGERIRGLRRSRGDE
jgi:hypothetical protein